MHCRSGEMPRHYLRHNGFSLVGFRKTKCGQACPRFLLLVSVRLWILGRDIALIIFRETLFKNLGGFMVRSMLLAVFGLCISSAALASNFEKAAQNFYLKQAHQQSRSLSRGAAIALGLESTQMRANHCDPDENESGPSCVATLCKSTSCYGSTGREIAEACRGASGRCVEGLCKSTSCYGSTGKEIAMACKGVSGLCVEALCKSTSCYGSTGKDIAEACKGSDGNCVEELCKNTSCYGSTGKEIARSCAGQ